MALEIMTYFHKRIKRLVNDKILSTLNFTGFELVWIALKKANQQVKERSQ